MAQSKKKAAKKKSLNKADVFAQDDNSFAGKLRRRRQAYNSGNPSNAAMKKRKTKKGK